MHAHPSGDRVSQCLSSYFALTQKGMGLSKLSRGQGVTGSSVDKGENKARVVESGREKETEEEPGKAFFCHDQDTFYLLP